MYASRLRKILQSNKNFKGIYISNNFEDLDLSFYEKIILSQVENLSGKRGFTKVTNEYLGLLLNKSANAVSKIISGLVKAGYLEANFDEKSRRLSLKPKNFWPKEDRLQETGGRLQETGGCLQETGGCLQETGGRQECSHNIHKYIRNIDKYMSIPEDGKVKSQEKNKKEISTTSEFDAYRAKKKIACTKATEIILAAKLPAPSGALYKNFGKYYITLGEKLFKKAVDATEIFASTPNLAYLDKSCATALAQLKKCDFDREKALEKLDDTMLVQRYSEDQGLSFEKIDDYFWVARGKPSIHLSETAKSVEDLCKKNRIRIPQLEGKGLLTLTFYAEVLDTFVFKKTLQKTSGSGRCYAKLVEALDLLVSKRIFHRRELEIYEAKNITQNLDRSVRKKVVKKESQRFMKEYQEEISKLPPIPLFKWSES